MVCGSSNSGIVSYLCNITENNNLGFHRGGLAIKAGLFLGTVPTGLAGAVGLGFIGSLVSGVAVGSIVALGIGAVGAYAIYYVGGLIDDV